MRLSVAILLVMMLANCTQVDDAKQIINKPPETEILTVGAPVQDTETSYKLTMEWFGYDPDGVVEYYLFAFDDTTVWDDKTKWGNDTNICIFANRREFILQANEPDRKYHTFYIKAVDNDSEADPSAATRSFTATTVLPDTRLIDNSPTNNARTSTYVSFRWVGIDEDGIITRYKYFWEDSTDWRDTSATSFTVRNLDDGEHFFGVKAIDNAGAEDPTPAIVKFRVNLKAKPSIDISAGPAHRQKVYADIPIVFEWKGDATGFHGLLHRKPYKYTFDDPDSTKWSDWTDSVKIDFGLQPIGTHELKILCRDSLGAESSVKRREFEIIPVKGPMNIPLLIVNDAELDSMADVKASEILEATFSDVQHDNWKVVQSSNPLDPPNLVNAEVVSKYKSILWFTDGSGHLGAANTEPYDTYLKHFLTAGGTLVIFGQENFANMENRAAYPVKYRALDSLTIGVTLFNLSLVNSCGKLKEFAGATPLLSGFPLLNVQVGNDSVMAITKVEVFEFAGEVEELYSFNSLTDHPQFEGKICAFRIIKPDYRIIYFGFPFYALQKEQAIELINKVKHDMNL